MNIQNIRQTVRDHILKEFLRDESPGVLTDTTPLISAGVLDSISTIKLASFLEEHFKIEFKAHEVSPSHLDTVAAIADTLARKLSQPKK